jgi:hypothetical protein
LNFARLRIWRPTRRVIPPLWSRTSRKSKENVLGGGRLPHFVERSADTCHAALAKMTSAVGVPGPAPFTKSLPARVGKLKPSKADHRAKRIVSRWPSRTRSLIARGPPAGSSISAEAWRSWHRSGFIACPASKRRQLATVGAHARSSTRKSFFLWTGNSPRRGVGPDVAVCCSRPSASRVGRQPSAAALALAFP